MPVSIAAHIPAEIWIKIAIILRDHLPCPHGYTITYDPTYCERQECSSSVTTRTLALSITCRFLRDILSYLLFETVLLGNHTLTSQLETPDDITFLKRRAATLMRRPEALSSTRKLQISNTSAFQIPVEPFLLQQLSCVVFNLRSVSLVDCRITPPVIQFLQAAKNMDDLLIQSCWWEDLLASNWSQGGFGGSLKKLTLLADEFEGSGCEENPPRYLQLVVPGVEDLITDTTMLQAFIPALVAGTLSLMQVKHLTITIGWRMGDVSQTVAPLLPFCPNVEDLVIQHPNPDNQNYAGVFPFHILPHLRRLHGPPAALNALKHRIDIRDLLVGNTSHYASIEVLPIAFKGLQSLVLQHVTWADNTILSIATQCPTLTALEVIAYKVQAPLTHWIESGQWIPESSGLPRLRRLILQWTPWPEAITLNMMAEITYPLSRRVEIQRGMIEEVKQRSCPDLEEVGLSPGYIWIYYPADDGWSPSIRPFD